MVVDNISNVFYAVFMHSFAQRYQCMISSESAVNLVVICYGITVVAVVHISFSKRGFIQTAVAPKEPM